MWRATPRRTKISACCWRLAHPWGAPDPRASVRDIEGKLSVAKFPHKGDETDAVRWEGLALTLAAKAGIAVPGWRIVEAAGKPILVLRRFDREGALRVPFLSAMSMLGANDLETRSYLEMADALRRYGAAPKDDLRALWRRIVFNVLVSNTDDHLRNHGFLYAGNDGWRLAPAYDLNPVPVDVKPRVLTTAIDEEDATASLELVLKVAGYFELEAKGARVIAGEVGRAVAHWRSEAGRLGLSKSEIERMASAFEHEDLRAASNLSLR